MEMLSTTMLWLNQAMIWSLVNFDCTMFILAFFFILLHRTIIRRGISEAEIVYRWIALFPLGINGVYTFIMHAFFPDISAAAIGWTPSPFQWEVAIADLAIGMLGILSFNASYNFRLATVIGSTIWLWGVAFGHLYQIIEQQNFATGNAGSWLWMDIIVPLVLIVCIIKLKRSR